MSHGWSVQFLSLPELVAKPSAMLSVREIVDALYQAQKQLALILASGRASRLHMSFRWPTKVNGLPTTTAAGLQFHRRKEDLLTLCRMGCCLGLIYTSYLTAMPSQLTLMYVYLIFSLKASWLIVIFLRTITRSCSSRSEERRVG